MVNGEETVLPDAAPLRAAMAAADRGAEYRELAGEASRLSALADLAISRLQFARQAGMAFDGKRDYWATFGYDESISVQQYRDAYDRGGLAQRIVNVIPRATWRGDFEVIEDKDPAKETTFEAAWIGLADRLKIKSVFERADILSQLSNFSIILLGAKDGQLEQELPKGKPENLLYLQPYLGSGFDLRQGNRAGTLDNSLAAAAKVEEWEEDPADPRYAQPKFYRIVRAQALGGGRGSAFDSKVHWSRVIHLAEGALESEAAGQPSLQSVWNLLMHDLLKVTGGGAESFWLRANQGLHLDVDKDLQGIKGKEDTELVALKKQVEDYKHQLTRFIRTKGVKLNVLGSDVADFSGPADALITQIAGTKGIPKRILVGAEAGELASTQDRENFRDLVSGRRLQYAGPNIVRNFVDRLVAYGYLPAPKGGPTKYEVTWPDRATLTPTEKANGARAWATVNRMQGKPVFTTDEIREEWGEREPLTVDQLEREAEIPPMTATGDGQTAPQMDDPDPKKGESTTAENDQETEAAQNEALKAMAATPAEIKIFRDMAEALAAGNMEAFADILEEASKQ